MQDSFLYASSPMTRFHMFKNRPIRTQMMFLIFGTAFAVLVVALTYFVHESYYRLKTARINESATASELLAQNSIVAVSFGDPQAATALLNSLRIKNDVIGAIILDEDGQPFAKYGDFENGVGQTNATNLPHASKLIQFDGHKLIVSVPLVEMDQQIGTLVTVTDTSDIQTHFELFVAQLLMVIVVGLTIVFVISSRILSSVVSPISQLTKVATQVSEDRDYSLRVSSDAGGEVGILCRQFNNMLSEIQLAQETIIESREQLARVNESLEERVRKRTIELQGMNHQLKSEIDSKEQAFASLQSLQSELVVASREAGMAEIASGVLHNIGNVLNSVKVASCTAMNSVQALKIPTLHKTVEVLRCKKQELGNDWVNFDGIQHLPQLLDELVNSLEVSQSGTIEELRELEENIDFIEEIVRSQQTYATKQGVRESVKPSEIAEAAIRMVGASSRFRDHEVIRDFDFNDEVTIDKNKVLQILCNFVKNGFEAMANTLPENRILTIRTQAIEPDHFRFSVEDQGEGIPSDVLGQLFTYGFTTKESGHGFGLHSAACAAGEMNGQVKTESDGIGKGARFSLELPLS